MAGVRKLKNWLDTYMEFTFETESEPLFHKWSGLSAVAAAMQRKVWFQLGRIRVHPNLFILLVSEPGIARKTQAIGYAEDLILEIPSIKLAADCTTREALMDDLELAGKDVEVQLPNGDLMKHNSLTIISGEFETFLGNKKDNASMLITLTDFFDCKNRPFKKRTKHSGNTNIEAVWLNLLAATTPESVAQCLPSSTIGGGLTSRMIYVWSNGMSKKVDVPEEPPDQMRTELIHDLAMISMMAGGFKFTPESREWWRDWYNSYDMKDNKRTCHDQAFGGWYSRKPTLLLKVAQVCSACQSSSMDMESWAFEEALKLLEETETEMGKVFGAVGRSLITADVDKITQIIKQHKAIKEKHLMQMVWRDMDSRKFDNVIDTVLRTGRVKRLFADGAGKAIPTTYLWLGGN
jgi:hypothetical protein